MIFSAPLSPESTNSLFSSIKIAAETSHPAEVVGAGGQTHDVRRLGKRHRAWTHQVSLPPIPFGAVAIEAAQVSNYGHHYGKRRYEDMVVFEWTTSEAGHAGVPFAYMTRLVLERDSQGTYLFDVCSSDPTLASEADGLKVEPVEDPLTSTQLAQLGIRVLACYAAHGITTGA